MSKEDDVKVFEGEKIEMWYLHGVVYVWNTCSNICPEMFKFLNTGPNGIRRSLQA